MALISQPLCVFPRPVNAWPTREDCSSCAPFLPWVIDAEIFFSICTPFFFSPFVWKTDVLAQYIEMLVFSLLQLANRLSECGDNSVANVALISQPLFA
ncbi:hypothetical protein BaRGS_00007889 [Batillaria attramentaria]|uniref:Uncharacterized protein n=1 Tax=Batillaria attramentaria TaxID=370345 RepID=A0ABD0LPT0_9CAEN